MAGENKHKNKNGILLEHLLTTIEITNIGIFVWNLQTDEVMYSKEWANIVGYEQCELNNHVSTWESMLYKEDLRDAEIALEKYLSGHADMYVAEFRMIKKDGTVIWAHDKGKITQYSDDGKPLILCGVLQDISAIKETEKTLKEKTDLLDLIIEVAEFGIWDWDMTTNQLSYNDEYLNMIGYTREETLGTAEEWQARCHPDDLTGSLEQMTDFLQGNTNRYVVESRMKHKDGRYLWARDIGIIAERDTDGNPTRMVGGHFNIHDLITTQYNLEEALSELEGHKNNLEQEIEKRTNEIIEQDRLLLEINDVSKKLLSVTENMVYDEIVTESLEKLAVVFKTPEISLWRLKEVNGKKYTYQEHAYKDGLRVAFDTLDMKEYISQLPDDDAMMHVREDGNTIISYYRINPDYIKILEVKDIVVDDFMQNIPTSLRDHLRRDSKNYRSFLLAPVYVQEILFGYVALSDEKENVSYSDVQSQMLIMCGNLFASARVKYEMDNQLRHAHEEALLSTQAKSNFLANMSHEIRTPLNAILGMSEIILRESYGGPTEEYAVEIRNASENLLSIINDILDISKIESGKLEVINLEYYITSLLNDVISLSRVRLQNRAIIFTTFVDSTIPAILVGDEIRIKQILLNLLSNAIKFTKSGNIHFNATCEHKDGKAILHFSVKDTGQGIKKEHMDRLFMQFERVNTKKNRDIEGTGLGLAITKQLCEMMGGGISVESEWGNGSTFNVTIPQIYTDYAPLVTAPQTQNVLLYEARELYANALKKSIENLGSKCTICTNQSDLVSFLYEDTYDFLFAPTVHFSKIKSLKESLKKEFTIVLMIDPGDTIIYRDTLTANLPITCLQLANVFGTSDVLVQSRTKTEHFIAPDLKVLVVDDNLVNLKVAQGLMSPYKFNIETAINGLEAVSMVKNNVYDLVFMDHMMPEMDGVDATTEIRKIPGDYYQKLPIIALTANALVGARELFINEGMNDFLAKPIEMHKLNAILLKWIPKDKVQFVSRHINEHEQNGEEEPVIAIDGIDTQKGIKAIGGSLDDYLDVLYSFYNDGVNKLKTIREAVDRLDTNAFRIDVHAVKSASASIGAFALSEKAKKLEDALIREDAKYVVANTDSFFDLYSSVLDVLKEKLQVDVDDANSEKPIGSGDLLKEVLPTLEEAIDLLDMDIIEQNLENCLSYDWKGDINSHLQSIKSFTEAFEYYNAKPPLEAIKEEIEKYY